MCSFHSILECCVMFSGVKLSIRSFVLFLELVQIYFVQIQFWGEIFRTYFSKFFRSKSHFWNFLSTQDPIFKFLLILL